MSRRLKKKETIETFHCVKWCGNFYTTFEYFFLFLFFPSIIFASPCILKKEVVSHDGTCRAIWEINDVTLIRSRLTKQGTRSNVIDAYECIQEHCTPSPLGEHFNHTLWSATMTSMLLHTERERGRERVKMRTDGMERNASWERGGRKKKLFRKMMQTKIRFPIWHVSNLPHSYTPLIIPPFSPVGFLTGF